MADAKPGQRLLRSVVRSQLRRLSGSSALFVLHQVGETLVPVVAGVVVDRAVVTGEGAALARWLLVLAVVFATLSISYRWGDRVFTRAHENAAHDLRLRLSARMTAAEGVEGGPGVGEAVSVATSDAEGAAGVLMAVASAVAGTAAVLFVAAVLVAISPPLGLLVLVGMPPVLVLLQSLASPIEARVAAQQAEVARAAATATDLLRGLRVLKGLGAEHHAAERYRQASRRSLAAGLRSTRFQAVHGGLTVAVTGAFMGIVALAGGRLAAEGRISVGELVAVVGVTQFLVGPLGRLGYAGAAWATARASAVRVATVLDAPSKVADGAQAVPAKVAGAISLRSLSHGGLVGVDLTVAAGEFVGIAVSDPVTAASLVGLLARDTDPAGGTVGLDGVGLGDLRLEGLRQAVRVAKHEAALFTGTLATNLDGGGARARGLVPAVSTELLAALAVDDVVEALPEGLSTAVTQGGTSLSGGQRQRVALARAVAGQTPVLVLHDPTTAVDAVTEARLAAGLRRLRAGLTTIIVTTSPALLAAADRVVFIDGTGVADGGSHEELVARDPRYVEVVLG
ncbi:MAG: ABC transporter ATP-binding protein [Acidimicrobiia bacterium]